jgi:uncharacterized membrane protein
MQEFLDFFGHGFCHQIRERTLEAGGLYFSVCARDTGIYLGLAITVVLVCLLYRSVSPASPRPSGLPPAPVMAVIVFLILPMAFDGISSYANLRETTNPIRFFTGYSAGMGVGIVASSAVLGMFGNSSDSARVLARPRQAVFALGTSAAVAVVFWLVYPYLGIVSPLIAVLAFLAIMVTLNALILSFTRRFGLSSRSRSLAVLALATCLSLLESAAMGAARDLIFGLLFNGSATSLQELLDW